MAGSTANENLIAGINQVVKAINDLILSVKVTVPGSGNGGGACGCSIPEDTIIDPPPATPPGNPATDPPPEGFDTWMEYNTYKCRAANKITDDLIATASNLSSIPGVVSGMGAGLLYLVVQAALFASGPAAIAEGLIALGLASAVGVAAVVTALVILIILSFGALAYFTTLSSTLSSQKQEIVCSLYEAGSVEGARSILLGYVDDAIVGIEGITEPVSDAMNSVVSALLGTAVFNTLFELNDTVSEYVGTIDCLECGCQTMFTFDTDLQDWFVQEDNGTGTDITWQDGTMLVEYGAGASPGARLQSPDINYVVQEGDEFTWTIISSTNYTVFAWLVISGVETQIYFLGTGASGTTVVTVDLTPWVGETVEAFRVYTAKGGAGQPAWSIAYDDIGIAC